VLQPVAEAASFTDEEQALIERHGLTAGQISV
jgi:hypothetical protein